MNSTGFAYSALLLIIALILIIAFILLNLLPNLSAYGSLLGNTLSEPTFLSICLILESVILLPAVFTWRQLRRLNLLDIEENETLSRRADMFLNCGYAFIKISHIVIWSVFLILLSFPDIQYLAFGITSLAMGSANWLEKKLNAQNKKIYPQRKGNPELQGEFEQQWLASWDEAERRIAYIAAYRTMNIMQYTFYGTLAALLVIRNYTIQRFAYDPGILPFLLTGCFALVCIIGNAVITNRLQKGSRIE